MICLKEFDNKEVPEKPLMSPRHSKKVNVRNKIYIAHILWSLI